MKCELPLWIPYENRFVQISCDFITFLLFEAAIWISINQFIINIPDEMYTCIWLFAAILYFYILWPAMNTLVHSMFIYYSIREVSVISKFKDNNETKVVSQRVVHSIEHYL